MGSYPSEILSFFISILHSLLWSALFLIAIPCIVALRWGYEVRSPCAAAGLCILMAGILLFLKSSRDLSRRGGTTTVLVKARELVRDGAYGISRNPVYISVILIALGETLLLSSPYLLLYTLALFAGLHLWVVFFEEPLLRRTYGRDFEDYCREVPRWVAFPRIWICLERRRKSRSFRLSP